MTDHQQAAIEALTVEDDVLPCDQCGTLWDMDGTMGKRNE